MKLPNFALKWAKNKQAMSGDAPLHLGNSPERFVWGRFSVVIVTVGKCSREKCLDLHVGLQVRTSSSYDMCHPG